MYVQAQEITKSFQNLTSELNDIMEVKKGHVRIGLPPMIGSGFSRECSVTSASHIPM